ncbi:methylated-DNA--[protein]-cysteine S-methyltransferase [Parendozoicomonas haliclonae]|uniref:Methylated-DNA--protein-cysteine methyltransferase n=1 Tax=Parendozoicomonas haliclonae TaxID=1960125 RepID=A0A1X7AF12_9GAMM|nr:methylated-DNA--[protein]-cysteine S-methyltransferase [Parendozoicomonas haliclonae]SMA34592.1 Methylated-DNA-protein-cysteine methyltransferase [Parendozoicomonas haliclonae]
MNYQLYHSPLGLLLLFSDGSALKKLTFLASVRDFTPDELFQKRSDAVLTAATQQLDEWFAGSRREFDLPLAPDGTPFQQKVWKALQTIPYGTTSTYGELAGKLGQPSSARAVGAANGKNPIALIIPCHRVIGADGSLTGYAFGLEKKKKLLSLEAQLQLSLI